MSQGLSFDSLKAKHRELRDGFENDLSLRVHRALSWLLRAEMAKGDLDAEFIFLWIAFNAAYASEIPDSEPAGERSVFQEFFTRLTALDTDGRLYTVIWQRFPQEIRVLLENKYVFQPFWNFQNALPGNEDWQSRFDRSKTRARHALSDGDTGVILSILFDRLYVLRNQLVHGGSTWNSSVNRDQVRDGANILGSIVPLFIDLLMDNAQIDWGRPYYPVVG